MCAALAVLMLCICCSREDEVYTPETEELVPITFGSSDVRTKGLDPLDNVRIKDKRFGIFAYTHDNLPYLENRDVEWVADRQHWRCSPAAFWPFQSSLSFFAYAPYDTTDEKFVEFLSEKDAIGMPRLRYTPLTDVTHQPDFCVAVPCLKKTKNDSIIHLSFHHTLTRLEFYANLKGENPNSYTYCVTNLVIRGVEGSNVLTYVNDEEKPYRWDEVDPDSPKTGVYNLSSSKSQLTETPLKTLKAQTEVNDNIGDIYTHINVMLNGRLYLLPQKLTSSAEIELTVSVYSGNNRISILPPYIFKLPENIAWKDESTVSYMMTLDLDSITQAEISAKVTAWKESGNSHSTETLE